MLLINCRYNWPVSPGTHKRSIEDNREYACLHFREKARLKLGSITVTVSKGAFVIIEPGMPISYTCVTPIIIDKMYVIGNVSELMDIYGIRVNTIYYPTNQDELIRLFESIEYSFYLRDIWEYRYIDIKFEELLILIAQHCNDRKNISTNIELFHKLKALRQEMCSYPERNWSVDLIAIRVGLSVSRLYPVYKELFGISPNRDLILYRVERVKQLLNQGKSLTESAYEAGYNNVSHCIRQFEKITGLTPKEFRAIPHRDK